MPSPRTLLIQTPRSYFIAGLRDNSMSTIALPRTVRAGFPALRDPALLIPLVGAGVLVYLAVLPLFMLLLGSFQAEVAPREFIYTLKNYHNAYASQYTYST